VVGYFFVRLRPFYSLFWNSFLETSLTAAENPNASALRRSAAMVYDLFFIVAIWILTTIVVVSLLNGGEPVNGWPFQVMLIVEVFAFYAYFWGVKGQTLGMQVWKIRTENEAGETLNLAQSGLRFGLATILLAPAGLGFFWMIVDRQRLTLYDRISRTRVVYLGSKPFEKEKPLAKKEPSASKEPSAE
jgi:uncharacterized RDD family membrane protein YckC